MKAKEKALELVDLHYYCEDAIKSQLDESVYAKEQKLAIRNAIITVDEIIKAIDWHDFETPNKQLEYYQQVKEELEKLKI